MASKLKRTYRRSLRQWSQNRNGVLFIVIALFCISIIVYTNYIKDRKLVIDPASYGQLLNVIAKAESNNNYNAYFGNASNSSIDFTNMSIADVMKWQSEYIQKGSASSAVGRYQIINTTLSGLVRQLGLNTSKKFDKPMQDAMAIALLERRGAESYINNEITGDQFAASIAKEWAGLPKVIGDKPEESYYASDGLNKSNVKVQDVLEAIKPISAKAQ